MTLFSASDFNDGDGDGDGNGNGNGRGLDAMIGDFRDVSNETVGEAMAILVANTVKAHICTSFLFKF